MQPERGDAVEAWLKARRNGWEGFPDYWTAVNDLLDDYRAYADFGIELGNELPDEAYK